MPPPTPRPFRTVDPGLAPPTASTAGPCFPGRLRGQGQGMLPDDLRLGALALTGRLDAALADANASEGSEWRRGWVLAAMGRYGQALAALDAAEQGSAAVAAAACGTRAAVLRDLGLHARAQAVDHRGLQHLQETSCDHLQETSCAEVRSSLLIGLVADGVGQGRNGREVDRDVAAAADAVAAGVSARQRVRLDAVTGEVALSRGDATGAATWFQRARRQAADHGLDRHNARLLVHLGAANAAAGNPEQAAGQAAAGLDVASRCGAEPVRWRALLVLAEATGDPSHRSAADDALGTLLASLPPDLPAEPRGGSARAGGVSPFDEAAEGPGQV